MALFLSENTAQHEPVLTLEEASLGLFEAVDSIAELQEAVLMADFTLHERNRGLSEEVIHEAEEGFFTKVARKVKELIIKVKEKVMAFFSAVAAKVKSLWARLTGGDATIKIAKNGVKAIDATNGALDKLVSAVESASEKNATKYTADVNKGYKAFETELKGYKEALTKMKETKSFEEVKISALNKVQAFANRTAALVGSTRTNLEKEIKVAEKAAAKKGLKAEELKEAQDELGLARARASAYTKLAQAAGGVSSLISVIIMTKASGTAAA